MIERSVVYRVGIDGGGVVRTELEGIGKAGDLSYEKIVTGQKEANREAGRLERTVSRERKSYQALKASVDPVYASQQRLARVQSQLNRAVSMGIVDQREAIEVMRQAEARTRSFAAANEIADTTMRGSNMAMRNALFQLNQVGQQAAVTGDLIGAAVIQVPDLFAGLGSLPLVAAGAAFAFGAAFLPQLLAVQDEAENLETDVVAAFEAVQSAQDASTISAERYAFAISMTGDMQGRVTPKILNALQLEAQARRALLELESIRLEQQRAQLRERVSNQEAELKRLADIEQQYITETVDPVTAGLVNTQAEQARVAAAQRVLDTNRELVLSIREGNAELDLVAARLALMDEDSAAVVAELDAAAAAAKDLSSVDIANGVRTAYDDAVRLAEQLGIAASAALSIAQNARFSQIDTINPDFYDPRNEQGLRGVVPDDRAAPVRPGRPVRSGGGGGGGLGDVSREAQRIWEATRTEIERFNIELGKVDALLAAGAISQETYNRQVELLRDRYNEAGEAGQGFTGLITGTKDAILDAVTDQATAFDRLAASIKRAAYEYLLFGTGDFADASGGGSFGGLLGGSLGKLFSFDGGGYTGNGRRSGGLDGKGGFLAMMHPRERVEDASSIGTGQGGMVPVFAVDSGVHVQWLSEAEARTAGMLQQYDQSRRRGSASEFQSMRARGRV